MDGHPDLSQTTMSLCRSCVSKRDVVTGKGSRFLLCERSRSDPSFPKYPMQPVMACRGYAPLGKERDRAEGGAGDSAGSS